MTLSYLLIILSPLIIGWTLDCLLGDPERLPHPIVWFGKWIAFGEHRLNKGGNRVAKGAVFAVASIVAVYALTRLLFAFANAGLYLALASILVFYCLAGRTLRKEVRMVFEAVDRSVEEGRVQVGRIVGRDTSELSAQEIRTAALETLAENLSDGVVAPLFWFFLLGVPGMLAYKMVNTLDSMIGYHNERYRDFGRWAAKIDDLANYIPARITALLIISMAAFAGKGLRSGNGSAMRSWKERLLFTCQYGPQHASPNSGWPEAALASILDCRFGGPHNYFGEYFYKPYIGRNPRLLDTDDMRQSISICFLAEVAMVLSILILEAGGMLMSV